MAREKQHDIGIVSVPRTLLLEIARTLRNVTDDYSADSNERWRSDELQAISEKVDQLLVSADEKPSTDHKPTLEN